LKRIALLAAALLAVVAGSAAEAATTARSDQTAQPVKFVKASTLTAGFFRGKTVRYFDFGPIKLAKGNKDAPIWTVTNGVAGQHNIIDTVPGLAGYSPLWTVEKVTFADGVAPRLLESRAEVLAAQKAGDVTIEETTIVVNCPVVGFGQKQVLGFEKGRTISYLDLGPVKLKPGNRVAPIWAVTNAAAGQHNIVNTVPGDRDYTPLWLVNMVTFKDGVTPYLLRSSAAVTKAAAKGDVTVKRTTIVVNCPVL
jgi:hypothetical protein